MFCFVAWLEQNKQMTHSEIILGIPVCPIDHVCLVFENFGNGCLKPITMCISIYIHIYTYVCVYT